MAGAYAHIRFEILAYSRRRIDEKYVGSVILDEDPSMSVLMPILYLYVFDYDNKVVHCHEVPSSPSR